MLFTSVCPEYLQIVLTMYIPFVNWLTSIRTLDVGALYLLEITISPEIENTCTLNSEISSPAGKYKNDSPVTAGFGAIVISTTSISMLEGAAH